MNAEQCPKCGNVSHRDAAECGEELRAKSTERQRPADNGREFPNGVLAKYAMRLTPKSIKDNDGDYIKGWNHALVLAEAAIREMNQAEQDSQKQSVYAKSAFKK